MSSFGIKKTAEDDRQDTEGHRLDLHQYLEDLAVSAVLKN